MKPPVPKNPRNTRKQQVFRDHLLELRSRLLSCVFTFLVGSLIGYAIHDTILEVLLRPLHQPVFYSSPAGGLDFVLRLSLFVGVLVAIPMCMYHTIRFVEPALPTRVPHLLIIILMASGLLLFAGMSFAYFISLPAALTFLRTFAQGQVQALIFTTDYFTFVTRYLLGFGLVFQLPFVLLAINAVHPLSLGSLLGAERWVILGSVVFAAILTPTPDVFNQLMLALPLIVLYQLSIGLLWIQNRTRWFRSLTSA